MKIPVIGVSTMQQAEELQRSTGMIVTVGRNGMHLVKKEEFKGFIYDDCGTRERMNLGVNHGIR